MGDDYIITVNVFYVDIRLCLSIVAILSLQCLIVAAVSALMRQWFILFHVKCNVLVLLSFLIMTACCHPKPVIIQHISIYIDTRYHPKLLGIT